MPSRSRSQSPAAQSAWKKLGLTMRGGFVRSSGYIGVIEALKEEGIVPTLYCGSSMGAIIGAIYASGRGYEDVKPLIKEQLKFRRMLSLGSVWGMSLVGQTR